MRPIETTLNTLSVEAQALFHAVDSCARSMFDKLKGIHPGVFVVDELNQVHTFDAPNITDRTRPIVWYIIGRMRSRHPVTGFARECWKTHLPDGKMICPSDDPKRSEAVIFNIWDKSRLVIFNAAITRNPDKVGDWEVFHDSTSEDSKVCGGAVDGPTYHQNEWN